MMSYLIIRKGYVKLNILKNAVNKAKLELKEMFATSQGWLSWLIANIITSMFWGMPLIYGFVFKDNRAIVVAGSIWTFMMLPITPFWILNVVIAVAVKNVLIKKKRGIINL